MVPDFLPAFAGGLSPSYILCPLAVPKGKEAYRPQEEPKSLIRSVGKK